MVTESIRREILKGFRTSETLGDFIIIEIKITIPHSGGFSATKTIGLLDGIHPAASAGLAVAGNYASALSGEITVEE